jgi:PTS system nitrogen regulatory IIA component
VPGTTPEATLRAVVWGLPLPPTVDREFLLSVLLSREALGSTAIGDGIAIPHVRNPIVLRVGQPLVSIGFLAEPVDFHAVDGLPVRVLFTLVTPTVRTHLHLLSRLAWLLRDARFRDAVRTEADRETLLALAGHVESSLESRAKGPAA